jgi:hypothetical protein
VRLFRRAIAKLRREYARAKNRRADCAGPTLAAGGPAGAPLPQRFGFLDPAFVAALARAFPDFPGLILEQAHRAIEHRFNLLGSGWVTVAHGVRCAGIEGVAYPQAPAVVSDREGAWLARRVNAENVAAAQSVWRLVDESYTPIDWQLDFKSGYRWREDIWHGDIRFGDAPGADVKVPWELARMQHLPALALACHYAGAGVPGFRPPAVYARELRDQVLDFVAANPPRFGVNWACAMDVAIRAANLLVARGVLAASGIAFDDAFERVFHSSLLAHGRHVATNLEWSPDARGNHYLADVAGLVFVAVLMPCSNETDAWLAFAVQELIAEAAIQFHEDGSHFEGSVCYHRLASETVLWTTALLSDLPEDKRRALADYRHDSPGAPPRLKPGPIAMHPLPGRAGTSPLPAWWWERLARMADYTAAMTKPGGLVAQFGDNDSGRFIPLAGGEQLRAGNDPSAAGWSLDHGSLVAGIDALLGPGDGAQRAPDPASWIVAGLAGMKGPRAARPRAECPRPSKLDDEAVWRAAEERYSKVAEASRWTCDFPSASGTLLRSLTATAFPGMGCYIFRGPQLYLAVRCGEIGLAGLGAHAHCDQLAIELVLEGKELVRDPGTYLYTPFPERRNAYRSAAAHHVPRSPGREPADLALGLFDLRGAAPGECLYFGPRGFVGRHAGYGPWVYRVIALEENHVRVRDYAEGGLPLADPAPAPLAFSPGYGRLAPPRAA